MISPAHLRADDLVVLYLKPNGASGPFRVVSVSRTHIVVRADGSDVERSVPLRSLEGIGKF